MGFARPKADPPGGMRMTEAPTRSRGTTVYELLVPFQPNVSCPFQADHCQNTANTHVGEDRPEATAIPQKQRLLVPHPSSRVLLRSNSQRYDLANTHAERIPKLANGTEDRTS